jgi:drug/metabolite transporter (DMT)-like permease
MVSIKFSNAGMPPMLTAMIRNVVAAILLFGFTMVRRQSVWLRGADLKYGLIIGVLFGLDFLFLYWGTAFTNASRAIIFLYTHPFWVALGAHFVLQDDRLTPVKIGGLILAFAGMIAVFGSGSDQLPEKYWVGDLMEILAAVFWAATTLYIKRVADKRPVTHYQTLFSQLFYSIPVLAAGWLLFELGQPMQLTGPVVKALIYQSVIVAFFSYVLWFWMIHKYPVSRLAAFTFLTPMFGVLAGGILMGDPLPVLLWIGLACVGGGIYLVNRV